MPVTFSRETVEAIAALAQLELDETEIEVFGRQLAQILDYANQVQQIDTSGVAPTTSVAIEPGADRTDVPAGSLARSEALANAPDPAPESGFFRVPRVIG